MNRLIYADPPWSYKQAGRGAAVNHYRCATMAEIGCHIEEHGNPHPKSATLACWQTWPMEAEQDALLSGMGWRKVTLLFLWIKSTVTGKEFFGGGLAGTRANTEPCFLWRRGKPLKRKDTGVRQIIIEPQTSHSAKPAEARYRLERLYGDVDRIELYSRGAGHKPKGWSTWGDEA